MNRGSWVLLVVLSACASRAEPPLADASPPETTGGAAPTTAAAATAATDTPAAASASASASADTPPTAPPEEPAFAGSAVDEQMPPPSTISTVRLTEPTVGPAYPADVVLRAMRSKSLLRCSERFADVTSEPASLRFVIETDGSVTKAEFIRKGSAVEPDARQACILSAIRAMSFPEPRGGSVTVSYPLNVDPA